MLEKASLTNMHAVREKKPTYSVEYEVSEVANNNRGNRRL